MDASVRRYIASILFAESLNLCCALTVSVCCVVVVVWCSGAIVKALAICTRHRFYAVFKVCVRCVTSACLLLLRLCLLDS